jgi:hypothetical protein
MVKSFPRYNSKFRLRVRRSAAIWQCLGAFALFFLVCAASAQTLARPGWTASGFTADPWWKHAVFYKMTRPESGTPAASGKAPSDWLTDAKSLAEKLDSLQSLRVDALILPTPGEQTPGEALDAFDDLVSQANRRGIRVVLALPGSGSSSALSERVRFWLSRGVAGFYVFTPPDGNAQDAQALVDTARAIVSTAIGGRIVISDLTGEPAATGAPALRRRHRANGARPREAKDHSPAQLQVDSHLNLPELPDAATLRNLIDAELPNSTVMLDLEPPAEPATGTDPYLAVMKSIAAIELTTHPVALVDADGALSPTHNSNDATVSDWYRQLISLHHGNSTLRYGTATPLDFDTQNSLVWVSRAPHATNLMPPVIVACNLTSSPVHLSLAAATRGLGLRGSFLRTLLRTDDSMGPQDLDDVSLPPFGVYIGELHR